MNKITSFAHNIHKCDVTIVSLKKVIMFYSHNVKNINGVILPRSFHSAHNKYHEKMQSHSFFANNFFSNKKEYIKKHIKKYDDDYIEKKNVIFFNNSFALSFCASAYYSMIMSFYISIQSVKKTQYDDYIIMVINIMDSMNTFICNGIDIFFSIIHVQFAVQGCIYLSYMMAIKCIKIIRRLIK
jgi:hypothetical protein